MSKNNKDYEPLPGLITRVMPPGSAEDKEWNLAEITIPDSPLPVSWYLKNLKDHVQYTMLMGAWDMGMYPLVIGEKSLVELSEENHWNYTKESPEYYGCRLYASKHTGKRLIILC